MAQKTKMGFTDMSEGRLFWRFDGPNAPTSHEKGSTQPIPKDEAQKSKPRPILLFVHAAVADHTLWDEQVRYFNS